MNWRSDLRTLAVITLLLPGLAIAAPIAGPCGLCDSGVSCPTMEKAKAETESHSCCRGVTDEDPAPLSFGSSKCDCGREAPPATGVDAATTLQTVAVDAPRDAAHSVEAQTGAVISRPASQSASPPSPPVFLIDCAFLT